ncbi:MAG: acetate--CoA ligase family protein [Gemmatimonadota bacterium]
MSGPGAHLDPVLRPRSVAVVGASADPHKRGHQAVRALQATGWAGRIVPVNPAGGEIRGLHVSRSLEEAQGPIDLALVCTPARTIPEVVAACGRAGVPAAILLAVGFGESGADGARLEEAVAAAAREGGVRLLGPNTSGLMNAHAGLNLIGVNGIRPGFAGLVVQSGNVALGLMQEARRAGVGISTCVGVGNELDLGAQDFLDALADDEATRCILLHAEGFRRGAEVVAAVARVARTKPVAFLKAARSAHGAAAARSHTGAVAGPYAAIRAALRQAGAVEARRSDELLALGDTLASQPAAPVGTGIAILSDGGGQGTIAVDVLEELGARRAELAGPTRDALRTLLGPAAAVANPVDLAGAADAAPERFVDVLHVLAEDEAVGTVLVVGLFGGYSLRFDRGLLPREMSAARGMAGAAREGGVGLVVHTVYAADRTRPLRALRDEQVPVVGSLEVACRCAAALLERGEALARPPWSPMGPGRPSSGATPRPLAEPEARELLASFGIPLAPTTRCRDEEEAVDAARALGGPVVLKVLADGLVHKSDVGGVVVGAEGDHEVRSAFRRVTREPVVRGVPGTAIRGAVVAPCVRSPLAELLVGVRRDPDVGALLTVGAGGLWVEQLADVSLRLLPVDAQQVRSMLGELRITPLLRGARGRPPADEEEVVRAALALADLLATRPEVVEAEVNPLFVHEDGAVGVDARVFVRGSGPSSHGGAEGGPSR